METVLQSDKIAIKPTVEAQIGMDAIVEDLQNKLVEVDEEKELTKVRQLKEKADLEARHAKENDAIDAQRKLIDDTLRGLLVLYPPLLPINKQESTVVDNGATIEHPEHINKVDSSEEEKVNGEVVETSRGEQGDIGTVKEDEPKRRVRGTLLSISMNAVRELDMPSTAEDVIEYIEKHHPGEELEKKDIRTSLKDSRRAGRLIGLVAVAGATPVYLNCLPEFFDSLTPPILSSDYQEKMLNQMIRLGLSWTDETQKDTNQPDQQKIDNVETSRFWKVPGFNWRLYIPNLLSEKDEVMNLSDFIEYIETKEENLGDDEKDTIKSTVSGTLSILRKNEKIFAHIPSGKSNGAFYGLESFFTSPKEGKLKFSYYMKSREKLGQQPESGSFIENEVE